MNIFITKTKYICGAAHRIFTLMSILISAIVLISWSDTVMVNGSSDSSVSPDSYTPSSVTNSSDSDSDSVNDNDSCRDTVGSQPVLAITLHFTNDYRVEDNLKIIFPVGTVSSTLSSGMSVSQNDVSYIRSENTHHFILKVRPYYAFDDMTAGKVKVTPILAPSAISSIPASNELAITNNNISFTAMHNCTTHNFTITLDRQITQVDVNMLHVGINTLYINAFTNSVNLFVNMFVHDSDTVVATNTAHTYPTRTTTILSHRQGSATSQLFTSIGKHSFDDTITPTNEATLPPFIMRSNTQYWLHVYYKDVHTGEELKDIHPFTTKALPTADQVTNTPTDYANTYASEYRLSSPIPTSTTADYSVFLMFPSPHNSAIVSSNSSFARNFNKSGDYIISNYDYNHSHKLMQSWIILSTLTNVDLQFWNGNTFTSTCPYVVNVHVCSQEVQYFISNLGNNKKLIYIYKIEENINIPKLISDRELFAYRDDEIFTFKMGSTMLQNQFKWGTSSIAPWVGTSHENAFFIRPIR